MARGILSNRMVTHLQTTRADERPDVYRAISDPTRRAILDKLRRGPTPVNTLASEFSQSRPAISKHLRILRAAHLVKERRSGRERYYRLEPKPLRDVARWLEEYRNFWEHNLNKLKEHLESESRGA
jgi:DNA-binding transcriptional ArsR family regulator